MTKDRYPYHYWILRWLSDKHPVPLSELAPKVETVFRQEGLWVSILEGATKVTRQRRFDSDLRNRIYHDLKPEGWITVENAVLCIPEKGTNWLKGKKKPTGWHQRHELEDF